MTEGEQIELFDGSNHIYPAQIIEASKKPLKWRFWGVNGVIKSQIYLFI